MLVGLYCIWHNVPFPTEEDWFGMGSTAGDFGLVVSNDGLHFREPVKGHVFLHRDDSPAAIPAAIAHQRILVQGNGILNVGDETRIYHGRWANAADPAQYHAEVALATLPRDRWGALGLFPDHDEGSVWTQPLTIPTGVVVLALNAEGAAAMRVEVADERFSLRAELSGANAGTPAVGDGLDHEVRWPDRSLSDLAGETVRFRVLVNRAEAAPEPRLYAAYLRDSS